MTVYVFGIVESDAISTLGPSLETVETSRDLGSARMLSFGPIAGIVSDVLVPEIRPNRRNLLAHMRILEAAQERCDVLPVRFGHAFPTDSALQASLEPRGGAILDEMSRLAGKTELAVRVSAEREAVMPAIADAHPDLKEQYKRAASKGAAGHYDLIELGRRTGDLVAAWRDAAQSALLLALEPFSVDLKTADPSDDMELLRGDFLVARDGQEPFERALASALDGIAHVTAEQLRTSIVGPAPPSSFVRLELGASGAAVLGSAA